MNNTPTDIPAHQSAPDEFPQHVLIAGCGYLGRRAAEAWLRRGSRVSAITRSPDKAAKLRCSGIQSVVTDLAGASPISALTSVNCVLWAVGFDRSTGTQRDDLWIHGLTRLIGALPRDSTLRRFLYVSSTSVYGDADGETVDESTPPAPTTEGGRACLKAEQHLRDLLYQHHPHCRAVILRMAGIYGPDRLLRRIEDLRTGTPLTAPADEWLNLIHVDDAAAMVIHASQAASIPEIINVVNSGTLTRREYYSRLAKLADAPPPSFSAPSTATASDASAPARRRSGNKRIVSRFRSDLPVSFRFDNVDAGLADAFSRTQ